MRTRLPGASLCLFHKCGRIDHSKSHAITYSCVSQTSSYSQSHPSERRNYAVAKGDKVRRVLGGQRGRENGQASRNHEQSDRRSSAGAGNSRRAEHLAFGVNLGKGTIKYSFGSAKLDLVAIISDSLARIRSEATSWKALTSFGLDKNALSRQFEDFSSLVRKAAFSVDGDDIHNKVGFEASSSMNESFKGALNSVTEFRKEFLTNGKDSLDVKLKHAFYAHVASDQFSPAEIINQKKLADLRYPNEWFLFARRLKRHFHVHVGPTNSGKTYHALKALENAERGLYAGPLRLLAHEVFARLNNKGKRTMLVTGEERRLPNDVEDVKDIELLSCTVEMVDTSSALDVAVIDEIQMIGHEERGWAWTQAVLGLKAREIHLCGEERAVPLITELVALMGDSIEIHRYERLTSLAMDRKHLDNNLSNLRKGDCIVAFSVLAIHALRNRIEQHTGKKVAIVYGSLPPETRAQQAALFNDPNNDYDYLVASDAIGMGLNLSVKRIIFDSSQKNDQGRFRTLKISEIKQIAGRAGRFRSARDESHVEQSNLDALPPEKELPTQVVDLTFQTSSAIDKLTAMKTIHTHTHDDIQADTKFGLAAQDTDSNSQSADDIHKTVSGGLVTTMTSYDYPVIKEGLRRSAEPIKSAGILPPPLIVERFATYFPKGTPFSYILMRLHEISLKHSRFHLCSIRDQVQIADAIQNSENLTVAERLTFCAAPASMRSSIERRFIVELAECVSKQRGGDLLGLDPKVLRLELLDEEARSDRSYLQQIETLHKQLVLYLWLSFRFTSTFTSRNLAMHVKELVEDKFEQALAKFSFSEKELRRKALAKEQAALQQQLADLEANASQDQSVAAATKDDYDSIDSKMTHKGREDR